jgi:drug/metabolite transporter (DMT)-like permease
MFVTLAVLVLPVVNACAKYLSDYSVIQITWARYAGHFMFMLAVFAPRSGLELLRSSRLLMQLIRSSLHCISAMVAFYALGYVSLPTATVISFSAPLMVTALAPLALGERVALIQWFAVGAGFIGACVVVRPGGGGQDWAVALLLLNATATAVIQLMSRKLSQYDGAATSNTYMVLVGFVMMSLLLPFIWRTPLTFLDALVFLGIGISGGVGHYLLVRAFEIAPAAFVSPFTYGQIVGATLLSYFVFGQLPDVWTWVGAAIIVSSGLFILYCERRSKVTNG